MALIATVARLPEDAQKVLAAALHKKPLVALDELEAQGVLDYGGLAVLASAPASLARLNGPCRQNKNVGLSATVSYDTTRRKLG
ncbi:hypothetical protein MAMT_01833 [Methylacidimicrobium tartarophylax]|uniref:Uncharacterized protein n=1 Tax=Methylacidimicrobium tartarophylax TaxID=1041768 RepID=A0A5E6MHA3_9BACT|nr:hypothetical protein MAMT_01833 [Methylacidimicrobium tartarophylax]